MQLLPAEQSCSASRYKFRISSVFLLRLLFQIKHPSVVRVTFIQIVASYSPKWQAMESAGPRVIPRFGVCCPAPPALRHSKMSIRRKRCSEDNLGSDYMLLEYFFPSPLPYVENPDILCNEADKLSEKSLAQRK